jgi:hypothetical protein
VSRPAALARRLRRAVDARGPSLVHAVLSRGVEAVVVVVLGWLALPLLPFAASAIARDWSYLRHYPRTLVRIAAHIAGTWRSDAVSRAWLLRFDPGAAKPAGTRVVGQCTHCGNCCLHKRCVFLEFDADGRSFCRIYGGKVWRQLPCGAYPVSQLDIDLYACPSFHTVPELTMPGTRLIPIRPVFSGERQERDAAP